MRGNEKWFILFVLAAVLFNWPFLSIFRNWYPYYLFMSWGALILVSGLVSSDLLRKP